MATYFGQISYTDVNTCKTVNTVSLKPLSTCQEVTDMNSTVITGHVKYTCGPDSAATVYYGASDSTCTTPTSSVPLTDYGVCPTTPTSSKSVCLASTDILSTLVKGIVYT